MNPTLFGTSNPRKARGGKQETWTIEEVRFGLEKFKSIYGRYPNAYEIDAFEYLPSCRSIQRSHGGYKRVRELLGLPIIHAGVHRSMLQRQSGRRGKNIEWDLYRDLVKRFGEEFVHREAPLGDTGWTRLDCVVFTQQGKFGVDIFYASTPHIVKTTVVIKTKENKHYSDLGFPIFLVVANNEVMSQETLDTMMLNKKNALPGNVRVLLRSCFDGTLNAYGRLYVTRTKET